MAKGGIELHPKLGVNPHMTTCTRCGGAGQELILLGKRNTVTICPHCGINAFGCTPRSKCPKCREPMQGGKKREIEERENIPFGLCKTCEDEVGLFEEEIKKGGVLIHCTCGMEGILKAEHPMAKKARDHFNLHDGEPCGVKVGHCPKCEEKHDRQTGEADQGVGDSR